MTATETHKAPVWGLVVFRGGCMQISDLEQMLASVKAEHGDLEVLCGTRPVGALVVLPDRPPRQHKAVNFVPRERRREPVR